MFKQLKHQIHSSNEEGIKEAVNIINTNNQEVVKIMPLGLEDKFCVFYHEKDKTIPPEEDIRQYTQPSQEFQINNPKNGFNLMELAKQYWFVLAIGLVVLLFYFYGGAADV